MKPKAPITPPRLRGEDWLDYWRRRLPVMALLIGKGKGRSVRGLGERATALEKCEETLSEAILLRKCEGVCRMIAKLHHRNIDSVPYPEMRSIMRVFVAEGGVLTHKAPLLKYIDKHFMSLAKSADWPAMWRQQSCWTPEVEFDPLDVHSGHLHGCFESRVGVMEKNIFVKTLMPMILEGELKVNELESLVKAGVRELDQYDVVEMGDVEADKLAEVQSVLSALDGLCTLRCDAEQADAMELIKKAPTGTGYKSTDIVKIVGIAVEGTPFYQQRLDMLLRIQVQLAQHNDAISQAMKTLQGLAKGDASSNATAISLCASIGLAMKDLPSDILSEVSGAFLSFLTGHWAQLRPKLMGSSSVPIARECMSLYREAAKCYPADDSIAEAIDHLCKMLSTMDHSDREETLLAAINDIDENFEKLAAEMQRARLEALQVAMGTMAGIGLSAKVTSGLEGALNFLFHAGAKVLDEGDSVGEVCGLSLSVVGIALELNPLRCEQAVFELIQCASTVKQRLASLERAYSPTRDFLNGNDLLGFASLLERAKVKHNLVETKLKADPGNIAGAALGDKATKCINNASAFLTKMASIERDLNMAEFSKVYNELINIPGADPSQPRWYEGAAADATYTDFEKLAVETFAGYKPKELKEKVGELKAVTSQYEQFLKRCGEVTMPPELLRIPAISTRLLAIGASLQFFYLLSKAEDSATRSYLVAETRELRAAGIHNEKEEMPEELFRSALRIMRGKAKK